MTKPRTQVSTCAAILVFVAIWSGPGVPESAAQIAGLATTASQPQPTSAATKQPVQVLEKPKAALAAGSGPITVHQEVPDQTLRKFLSKFLPKYPGIRRITVAVDDGVVTLTGQVDDDDTHDEITDVVKRVEGVRLVMNNMKTDEQSMSALEFAARDGGAVLAYFKRSWVLITLAIAFVVISMLLARLFATRSETILAPSSATSSSGRSAAPSSARSPETLPPGTAQDRVLP